MGAFMKKIFLSLSMLLAASAAIAEEQSHFINSSGDEGIVTEAPNNYPDQNQIKPQVLTDKKQQGVNPNDDKIIIQEKNNIKNVKNQSI